VKSSLGSSVKVLIAEELPMKMALSEWRARPKVSNNLKMCSVARISPEKNTLYALERLLQVKNSKVTYDIYGPIYNDNYWVQCKKVIERMPENINVNYMGSIQGEKVLETLANYHVMFMPTNGENFGHTILESFMAATPVIISQNTPWKSLELVNAGWDLSLNMPQNFVAVIEKLAEMDQESYNLWSESALNYADKFMKNNSILEQNIKLFEDEH
jgi:glycosyltransferase involved in cell wall biosynthesis